MNALSPISVDSSDWGSLSANGYVNSNPASLYNTKPPLMPPNNPSNLSRLADTPPQSVHSSANSSNPPDGQPGPPHRANGNPSPPNSVARSSVGTNATGLMDERKFAQMEAALAEHHRMLVRYLAPALRELRSDPRQNPAARDKLVRLSASQFQELSTDVYDELTRREDERRRGPGAPGNPVPKYLLPKQNFHPKRNQARQKLSTLPRDRFQQLAMDVLFELERRFPRFAGSASRAESIPERNSPSRQGFPLRSASHTGPDAGPEGFGPRSASRAGPEMGDFGPRSASRARPDMGGPDGFQRSASRGPPDKAPDGFAPPPFNGPRMDSFPNDQAKPMAKMYQSNVMVPNKGTMIEDDSEAENPKPPMNDNAQFDNLQLKVAELTSKLREKDLELEKAQSEPKELNAVSVSPRPMLS